MKGKMKGSETDHSGSVWKARDEEERNRTD